MKEDRHIMCQSSFFYILKTFAFDNGYYCIRYNISGL